MEGQDQFYIEVGRRIRDARKKRRPLLTQDELAKLVGLTRTSITNIEQGRQKCLVHTLGEIANALQIEPASLFPPIATQVAELKHALKHRTASEKDWIMSAVTAASAEKVKNGA